MIGESFRKIRKFSNFCQRKKSYDFWGRLHFMGKSLSDFEISLSDFEIAQRNFEIAQRNRSAKLSEKCRRVSY